MSQANTRAGKRARSMARAARKHAASKRIHCFGLVWPRRAWQNLQYLAAHGLA